MKACEFTLERPDSIRQALDCKARWGEAARFLAGGQSLMPAVNMRLSNSECLIDLNAIDALRGIHMEGDTLVIGALARHAEVVGSPLVRTAAPVLVQAGRYLAHVAIRNRGTFGGSVALADPAAEWPAACLLLGASMRVTGLAGSRDVPAAAFFKGMYMTDLAEDELLESVSIPSQPAGEASCVLELARRRGDFASAGVMARAREPGRPSNLQMVFFGVGDMALHDAKLNEAVQRKLEDSDIEELGPLVTQLMASHDIRGDLYTSAATKRYLCGVLARRAANELMGFQPRTQS